MHVVTLMTGIWVLFITADGNLSENMKSRNYSIFPPYKEECDHYFKKCNKYFFYFFKKKKEEQGARN